MSEIISLTRNVVALIALIVLVTACAHKTEQAEKPVAVTATSGEAHYVANENEASYVTELKFKKGSFHLSQMAKDQLRKIYDDAKLKGSLGDIKIIAWADLEYPSVSTRNLSKTQIKLAAQRGEEIQKYLSDFDHGVSIDTYNMAERPNALAELFSTENARIKRSLEVAGIPNTNTAVKVPSKASHAIVMLILKD